MTERNGPGIAGALEILYVEDYAPSIVLLRDTLMRRAPDIRLDVATTVGQAIERLNRFEAGADDPALAESERAPRYDVVLTDLRLTDGSGLDVLAHVRKHHLNLAVVILSASNEEDTAIGTLAAGADAYIVKCDAYLSRLPDDLRAALMRFRNRAAISISDPRHRA
jgi:DNA-binding NarL/FixJ family response regulator